MPDVSGLYPQPPQQQQNSLLANPLGTLGTIMQLRQMQGQQQAGNALISGLNPNGTYNPGAAVSALKSSPLAGYAGAQATAGVLANRGADIENATRQFGLASGQNAGLMGILGPLAANPNTTKNDILNLAPTLARAGYPPQMISGWIAGLSDDPKTLHTQLANLGNIAMGAAAAASRVTGPVGPNGEPTQTSLGATNVGAPMQLHPGATGPQAGAAPSQSFPVGLPPGQAEAAQKIGGESADQAVNLTRSADTSPVRKAMLGNLETDLGNFTSGPGADWTKVAKAAINRNLPLPPGMQFDPTSIASQEAFTKQAEQLAQQQFATIGGTGTDAKFGSAFKSNPNDTLSQMGNSGIIGLLKGNEDAIQVKNSEWQKWLANGHPPQSYPQFAQQFNSTFDPRIYQTQYMSQDDVRKMAKAMSPQENNALALKMQAAIKNGWAVPPGSYYSGVPGQAAPAGQ